MVISVLKIKIGLKLFPKTSLNSSKTYFDWLWNNTIFYDGLKALQIVILMMPPNDYKE